MSNKTVITIKRLTDLPLPNYASVGSAGMDLYAAIDQPIILNPMQRVLIPCGFSMALPTGLEAQIRPRSGLALKHGITVLNSPGTIDADYRGEIGVILQNMGDTPFRIERALRIAQMVIASYVQASWTEADRLPDSVRSDQGFGSTGV